MKSSCVKHCRAKNLTWKESIGVQNIGVNERQQVCYEACGSQAVPNSGMQHKATRRIASPHRWDAASSPGIAPCLSVVRVGLWDCCMREDEPSSPALPVFPLATCFPARNSAWGQGRMGCQSIESYTKFFFTLDFLQGHDKLTIVRLEQLDEITNYQVASPNNKPFSTYYNNYLNLSAQKKKYHLHSSRPQSDFVCFIPKPLSLVVILIHWKWLITFTYIINKLC